MFEEWREARHEDNDLDLIPVMNLFMVLIPFLLMGAAFFHVSVIPTSTPNHTPSKSKPAPTPRAVSASLLIKPDRVSLTFSSSSLSEEKLDELAGSWPATDGQLPVDDIQKHLVFVKKQYPKSTTLVVLPHQHVEYQTLVEVLDSTRDIQTGTDADGNAEYKELFPVTVFSKLVESDPADEAPTGADR